MSFLFSAIRQHVLFGFALLTTLAAISDASACHLFRRRQVHSHCPPSSLCPALPHSPCDSSPRPDPKDPKEPKDPEDADPVLPKVSDLPPEVPNIIRPDFLKEKK